MNVSGIPLSIRNAYLRNERKIISSASSIQSRSEWVVGGERRVYTIFESIYEWVT